MIEWYHVISENGCYVSYVQVKFHIISYHHLHRSSRTPNTASMSHLNLEQLMKALTTLFTLYEVNRASHSMSQNEAEFFSLYLLLHLGPDNQVMQSSSYFIICLLTCSLFLVHELLHMLVPLFSGRTSIPVVSPHSFSSIGVKSDAFCPENIKVIRSLCSLSIPNFIKLPVSPVSRIFF